ncbi:MAG: hypothetical protein ACRDAG_08165 [Cetobacterium somerae]|uniref:hypothetical protein n=1 Tax=Cetobacterium somerae TaxID=188913 RepID=UPI003F3794D4
MLYVALIIILLISLKFIPLQKLIGLLCIFISLGGIVLCINGAFIPAIFLVIVCFPIGLKLIKS